jgi:hypothetical protein
MRLSLFAVLAAGLLAPAAATRAAPEGPKLDLPLACQVGRTCEVQHYVDRDAGAGALDYRCGRRTYDGHNGVDIRLLDLAQQRRGVDVLAAAAGRVARLRDTMADVSVRDAAAPKVEGVECGNGVVVDHGGGWETQYCHLARGSVRVTVGQVVKAGEPLGRVGLSGKTEFPHLHMTIRHAGKVVDPFEPADPAAERCGGGGGGMWTPAARAALAYKAGTILNAGFAGHPLTMAAIEQGGLAAPGVGSPAVVAYMRAIGLEEGDVMEMTVKGPQGLVLGPERLTKLDHDKAQAFAMLGRKRPAAGWPRGRYSADLRVLRAGKPVAVRQVAVTL